MAKSCLGIDIGKDQMKLVLMKGENIVKTCFGTDAGRASQGWQNCFCGDHRRIDPKNHEREQDPL